MNKNILLIELKNNNLGDTIISETCEYIVRDIDNSLNINKINLFPNKEIMKKYKPFYGYKLVKSIFKRLKISLYFLDFIFWKLFTKAGKEAYNYYYNNIKVADKVIVVGGGLIKYSREDFWKALYTITEICEQQKKLLYINAVGVEGFDSKNFRCKLLSASLSRKNVIVTTRDDLKSLKKYLKKAKDEKIVGDPALYTEETYKIKANINSEIIGIGLIRGKIYTDYGFNFKESDIINSYVNIIKELEKNNYKWQLFCNGIISDYEMGKKILKKLNLPIEEKYLVKRPQESRELIKTISNYKAIIAARLHANIVATSLGIPSIGLVWNDKLKFFGKIIGCENRFIEKEKFVNAEYVLAQLEEAINNKYDVTIINNLMKFTKISLETFINKI